MTRNRSIFPDTLIRVIAAICLAVLGASPVLAQTESDTMENKWQFSGALYIWGLDITGRTKSGSEVELEFDDILDRLDMAFLGALEARKNKWLLFTDLSYLDVSGERTTEVKIPIGGGGLHLPVTTFARVNQESWIVHLAGGYNLISTNKTRLDVIAGARYLDLETEIFLRLQSLGPGQERTIKESLSVWDGIIGLKGNTALSQRWFLGYYADIGAGDSNFTWHASALIGYKATRWLDLAAGYRHIEWDLDKARVLDELKTSGPTLGLIFRW